MTHRYIVCNMWERWRTHVKAVKKLTQAELGKRIGKSEATVSRIEDGLQPYTQYTLEAIADALGAEPDQLIRDPPGQAAPKGALDLRLLELSISVALGQRPRGAAAQIARAARVYYPFLLEAKGRGEDVNDETAAQILLGKLVEREDI